MKPWVKGTKYGKLYIDKTHPEFKKWFIEQIEKYAGKIKINEAKRTT